MSKFARRGGPWLLFSALIVVQPGCSGDDADKAKEPVEGAEANPDNPEGQPPVDGAETPPADPAADAQNVGQLTEQPPAAAETPPPAPPPEQVAPTTGTEDSIGGAFENPDSQVDSGAKGKKGKGAKASKGHVTRYVKAWVLNVRSKPAATAPIVKRLLGGTEISIEVHGKWGKIKNGQWVRTKFLSENPTKHITKEQALSGMKGGGGGETAAPAKGKKGKGAKTAKKGKAGKTKKAAAAAAPAPAPAAVEAAPVEEAAPAETPEEPAPETGGEDPG